LSSKEDEMPLGGAAYFVGADAETVFCASSSNISVGVFPSGTDTVTVEATLDDPRDADATWFDIVEETNDSSVVSLAGPVAGIRFTRASGAADDNKMTVLFPGN
jgi:hypothetical protein